jgi:hypothetical protein
VAFGSSAAGGLLARVGGLLESERPLAGGHLRGSGQVRCGCGCWLCCGPLSFWLCFGSLSCWLCFGTLSCWLCFVTLSCWLCFDTLSCWLVLLVGRQDLAVQLLRHPLEQSCRVRLGFRDDFSFGPRGRTRWLLGGSARWLLTKWFAILWYFSQVGGPIPDRTGIHPRCIADSSAPPASPPTGWESAGIGFKHETMSHP